MRSVIPDEINIRHYQRKETMMSIILAILVLGDFILAAHLHLNNVFPSPDDDYKQVVLVTAGLLNGFFLYYISSHMIWYECDNNAYGVKFKGQIIDYVNRNIVRENWWERAYTTLNRFSTGEITIKDREMLPMIVIHRFFNNTGLGSENTMHPEAKRIINHPAYPKFKKKVRTTNLLDVMEGMGIDVKKHS